MLEKLLAAEVLEVRILHPAIAQSSPAISRIGNDGRLKP
jgi:hypothetical protein